MSSQPENSVVCTWNWREEDIYSTWSLWFPTSKIKGFDPKLMKEKHNLFYTEVPRRFFKSHSRIYSCSHRFVSLSYCLKTHALEKRAFVIRMVNGVVADFSKVHSIWLLYALLCDQFVARVMWRGFWKIMKVLAGECLWKPLVCPPARANC